MELHFTVRERKVGGKTEYVIRLNDRVLRSYQEPPSQEEINTMLIAVKQALREYTNCMHAAGWTTARLYPTLLTIREETK